MRLPDGGPDLTWLDGPGVPEHEWSGGVLRVTAGPRTDWFRDPGGAAVTANAPIALAPLTGPGSLAATLACDGTAQFDAAALYVFAADDAWGKLALERNPEGEQMIVSVVTDGTSDDCNHRVVAPAGSATQVRLRVSSLGAGVCAFHVAAGGRWELLRHFGLGGAAADAVRVGVSAQSPLGEGCTATFTDLDRSARVPADVRDGT